jgi:hypothetical protein
VILLAAPLILWVVGHTRGNGENTVRQGFPKPEATLWLDRGYYQAVEGWFKESLPTAKPLNIFNHWLNYHLFSASPANSIHIGIHGWLYARGTTQARSEPATSRWYPGP